MTCSLCKAKGHNKRSCPHAEGSTSAVVAAASAFVPHAGRRRGRGIESAPSTAATSSSCGSTSISGRGRGKGSAPSTAAASSSCGSISISGRGRGKGSAPPAGSSSMPYAGSTCAFGRGRARGKESGMDARGRGKGTNGFESSSDLEGWFNCSDGSANNTLEKRRNSIGSRPFKRPRIVVPCLPSQRVVNLGARIVISSTEVTDIGYQSRTRVKWKRKVAMTTRRLQQMRGGKIIQTRSKRDAAAKNSSQNATSRI
ncbi:uncharacterized protein LOC107825613 [Nicotiana tabacum]|uniref:Uncharacterized protein isoform X2 n=1 Tax=Nicotiana tabacum TaxID=4097 RepID=A0A1S4D3I9_TOBAC|nr:PREDICTED: uncharacterized protein LOC107825613 isoform X2 [Nicotiana tabacum]